MRDLWKTEFALIKHLKLQPSEIDALPFYRIEYLIEDLKEYLEEQKKAQNEEDSKYKDMSDMKGQANSLFRQGNQNLGNLGGKIPGMSGF